MAELEELRRVVKEDFQYEEGLEYKSGGFEHVSGCPLYDIPPPTVEEAFCPVERYNLVSGRLKWWRTIGFLSWFFRNPQAATGQKILNEPKTGETIVVNYEYDQDPSLRC